MFSVCYIFYEYLLLTYIFISIFYLIKWREKKIEAFDRNAMDTLMVCH